MILPCKPVPSAPLLLAVCFVTSCNKQVRPRPHGEGARRRHRLGLRDDRGVRGPDVPGLHDDGEQQAFFRPFFSVWCALSRRLKRRPSTD